MIYISAYSRKAENRKTILIWDALFDLLKLNFVADCLHSGKLVFVL